MPGSPKKSPRPSARRDALAVTAIVLIGAVLAGCDPFGIGSAHKSGDTAAAPVFAGFEQQRYQNHDELILELVADFNAHKADYAGATPRQAAGIPDLTPALVKAWIIQESGGQDPASFESWRIDPARVNVPGEWIIAKRQVGLKNPDRPGDADARSNLKAAIALLSRMGFGPSGRPASRGEDDRFDTWMTALARYDGEGAVTEAGKRYRALYAERIIHRANNPGDDVPIALPAVVEGK